MNPRPPLRFLGYLTLLLAATELAPALCAAAYREWDAVIAFLISALVTALVGAMMVGLGSSKGDRKSVV